jgi:hypothetical protein
MISNGIDKRKGSGFVGSMYIGWKASCRKNKKYTRLEIEE